MSEFFGKSPRRTTMKYLRHLDLKELKERQKTLEGRIDLDETLFIEKKISITQYKRRKRKNEEELSKTKKVIAEKEVIRKFSPYHR